ncbi:hypothetical protein [Nocardioides sambongensis]|uniref:hypothetical protein n=1 Tax=Nocardioides sambongensis TaxID=2589074 RepID=UPI001129DA4B|nr:hypothetical protein [Nocardioides sambongensis]
MSDSDPCFPDSTDRTPGGTGALARGLGRRELAGLAAAAAAAPVIAMVPTSAPASPGVAAQRLRLQRDAGSPVSALDVPLDDRAAEARTVAGGALRTPVMQTTSSFAMLGVTWRSGSGTIRARARRVDGGWTGWRRLPAMHDGPDPGSAEGRRTPNATHPVWFGACDAVQIEITGTARKPVLALIDPGERSADRNPVARRAVVAGRAVESADSGESDQAAQGKVAAPRSTSAGPGGPTTSSSTASPTASPRSSRCTCTTP